MNKKVISEARKKQLLLNLKKGRETSRINRQKKATAKKIKKQSEVIEIDETIKNYAHKTKSNTDYENEILTLKEQLKNLSVKSEPIKEVKEYNDSEATNKKIIETIPQPKKSYSFVNQDLITKVDTENETNFSTFKSSLW
mgnify:FL=1